MPTTTSFKDMPLWQRAMRLTVDVINLSTSLPAEVQTTLGGQMQEAAITLPTGLALGSKAGKRGFQAALLRGRQSAAELETLLLIVQQAYPMLEVHPLVAEAADMQLACIAMIKRLDGRSPAAPRKIV